MQIPATNFKASLHNQRVERHVKLVTEASPSVEEHDNRAGMICQRIRSRKLMKTIEQKCNLICNLLILCFLSGCCEVMANHVFTVFAISHYV